MIHAELLWFWITRKLFSYNILLLIIDLRLPDVTAIRCYFCNDNFFDIPAMYILQFIYSEKATKMWRNLQILFEILFLWPYQNLSTLLRKIFVLPGSWKWPCHPDRLWHYPCIRVRILAVYRRKSYMWGCRVEYQGGHWRSSSSSSMRRCRRWLLLRPLE